MEQINSQIRKEATPNQSLFRFIEDAYCERFVKEGKIRFGNIQKYVSENNDVRDDVTESIAAYSNQLGGINSSAVFNEAVYILSCAKVTSNEDIRKLAQKFNPNGTLFLEIFNPLILINKIKNLNLKQLSRFIPIYRDDIYWVDVEYSKGLLAKQDAIEYSNIHIFQKPREEVSPQVISKVNGMVLNRPQGGAGLHMMASNDIFDAHWPIGRNPINYEEEQECRLVLDCRYSIVFEREGGIFAQDEIDSKDKSYKPMLLPDVLKVKIVDIECGNLEDCVRIRDIRDINN